MPADPTVLRVCADAVTATLLLPRIVRKMKDVNGFSFSMSAR